VDISTSFPNNAVACTLGCYRKSLKEAATDPARLAWDDDTAEGLFPMSSEAMLLDWLKTPGNYANWRGNDRGITKLSIQQQIADSINAEGLKQNINRQRTEKQVGAKIVHLEQKFRSTLSFMENTGQGIKDEKNLSEEKFKELITNKWCHFWDLFDIMSERSCMRPVCNSEVLDDEEDADDLLPLGNNEEDSGGKSTEEEEQSQDPFPLPPLLAAGAAAELSSPVREVYIPSSSERGGRKKKMRVGGGSVASRSGVAATGEVVMSIISMLQDEDKVEDNKNRTNAELKAGWDAAQAESEYTMTLKEQYDRIKGEYSFSDIARMFPQFICLFPRGALSRKQKMRFSERYNEWAASRSLPLRLDLMVDEDDSDDE
jgi:hypothetical protein